MIAAEGEPVAGAHDGLQDAGVVRVGFELVSQVADVRVDGAFVAFELVAAGAVDQLVPGEHAAGGGGEGAASIRWW